MAGPRRLISLSDRVTDAVRSQMPAGSAVVALSGGADSAVCAWAVKELGGRVRAVFVHHGLPGSDLMEVAAKEVAEALELSLDIERVSIPVGPSPEAQARSVRYSALEAGLEAGEWLVTGHTADDQAETILANLIRGTGLSGLAGMAAKRGRIVRPLLSVWRRETRELATILGLPWKDDPSNLDESTPRNALRRSTFPDLERTFNPALREALVRLAAQAGRDEALLDEQALSVPVTSGPGGEVRIPVPALAGLPLPLRERVVRRALRVVHAPYGGSDAEVRAALAVAAGEPSEHIEGGVAVIREGPWLALVPARESKEPPDVVAWRLRGEVRFGQWRIEAWVEELAPTAFPLSPWTAVFDADLLPSKGEVRGVRPGDVMAMLVGNKQVKKALAEAEVPVRERESWPAVTANDDVLWIPGVRSAQRNWVTLETRRYLWMRAEREAR